MRTIAIEQPAPDPLARYPLSLRTTAEALWGPPAAQATPAKDGRTLIPAAPGR